LIVLWINWPHTKRRKKATCHHLIVFLIDRPQKNRGGGERPNAMMAACDGLKKRENERQVAMAASCHRSSFGLICHTKRRKKAACHQLIIFKIDRPQKDNRGGGNVA